MRSTTQTPSTRDYLPDAVPDDGRPSGRRDGHGRGHDAADALDARVGTGHAFRRRRRVDVVEHGLGSYRREQRIHERRVRRTIRERWRRHAWMEMQGPRKRRTQLLAAAAEIAAVLVQRRELRQTPREGIFRVLLEGAQRGLRRRRDFPRKLRA